MLKTFASGAEHWRLHPTEDVERVVAELKSSELVEYAEPNYIYDFYAITPNDPNFSQQWHLRNTGQSLDPACSPPAVPTCVLDADIDADEAWDITTGSSSVKIAIVDSGIAYGHPDLSANGWINPGEIAGNGIDDDGNGYIDDVHGYDFYNNASDPLEVVAGSHGTQCAGVSAAATNNSTGGAGVSWSSKLMALKAGESNISSSAAASAIDYAAAKQADIINASWGGGIFSQTLKNAIKGAQDKEILFVNAAGNSNLDLDAETDPNKFKYPQQYDNKNIIVVASTDCTDTRAFTSNWGATLVDLAAPGNWILGPTYRAVDVTYGYSNCFKGTSAAAPVVAGVAALIRAIKPSIPAESLKGLIMQKTEALSSGSGLGPGKTVTGGRLNARKAVENQDTTNPNAVSNLNASNNATQTMNLTWTAVGDDGSTGTATFNDVRYSTSSITGANFSSATRTYNEPAPAGSGTAQSMTASGLAAGTCYNWAMKSYDEWGNAQLSNVKKCGTRPPVYCVGSYCKESNGEMLRCTSTASFGACGCCNYSCVADETCTVPDPPPTYACGNYCQ